MNDEVGNVPSLEEPGRLLKYLPDIYADDSFLAGFLGLFDSFWLPLERQIGQMHRYFDPVVTPSELLPWLGTWVDLVLDENWPEERRRALIGAAADLYRRRGTVKGLRDYLAVYMGLTPQILEDGDAANPFHFTVVFHVPAANAGATGGSPAPIDEARLRQIINQEKPAHTTYSLQVERT